MPASGLEWARLADGRVVVSTENRSWLTLPRGPWGRPMTGQGSVRTTGRLLEAATQTGWDTALHSPEPPFTLAHWAYRLCGFYQTTHSTPRLMAEAAVRFDNAGRDSLAQWARDKAREEQGHDTLVLRDLTALGLDAETIVAEIVPPIPAALVGYFEKQVFTEDPIGCVGYSYALERLALEIDAQYIARVEARLPRGVRATRCLRVHSAIGSDKSHVDETVALVASLHASERSRIASTCYETAVMCYQLPGAGPDLGPALLARISAALGEKRIRL